MRKILIITVVLLLARAVPCQAQYGWAPPNYSVTGVRAEDCHHYRGLCEILRERLRCKRERRVSEPCCSTGECADTVPTATLLPPVAQQPPSPVSAP